MSINRPGAGARAVVTIADIAAMSGVSDMTVRRWLRRAELGFPRPLFPPALSRTLLFDRREVDAWLHGQRDTGSAP
jgi:excisionase family DNA binding protein